MSLCHECLRHPKVRETYDRAWEIVLNWIEGERRQSEHAEQVLGPLDDWIRWWPGVVLAERLTLWVLESQGFDIEAMNDAIEAETNDSAIRDLLALDWSVAAVNAREAAGTTP